ncbi:3'-5' exonuclease domain-containing protein [Mycena kentingensis (nom. inval.)]|nr:3'-5' exonuclease domain-containing protein [Mycena kentingensis (nom. inval.)]
MSTNLNFKFYDGPPPSPLPNQPRRKRGRPRKAPPVDRATSANPIPGSSRAVDGQHNIPTVDGNGAALQPGGVPMGYGGEQASVSGSRSSFGTLNPDAVSQAASVPRPIPVVSRPPAAQRHSTLAPTAAPPSTTIAAASSGPPDATRARPRAAPRQANRAGVVERIQAHLTTPQSAPLPTTPHPPIPTIPSRHPATPARVPPVDTPPRLGLVTDIDDECDSNAFLGEGIGLDDDEDDEEGGDMSKRARTPYPDWFQTRLDRVHDRLKTELASTRISSGYRSGMFWDLAPSRWSLLGRVNVSPMDLFVPDFFVWDPAVFVERIPCPKCRHHLTRDGAVYRPRRIVDVDRTFWIIGYTYACQKNTTAGCGSRFRSWDKRVLECLPRPLAAEFPAVLTWRSGLSTRAFGVVRSCFQHGMGAAQVADLFRMQHLRRYDELRLAYLQTKLRQVGMGTYQAFPAFDDRSSSGFHGFTPSGQWLRDVYDDFVESHKESMNQHTALLTARICAIDHSHKLAKHVFKVDGVPIFTALLTVTNEKGEILVCVFVATKSHSQYEDALRKLAHDLVVYGHNLPEVFYTDNMVDKPMLEKLFASLREGVSPVEKHSNLPMFIDPPCVENPDVLDSETSINNVCRSILSEVPENGTLVVGFDSEWNLEVAPYGAVTGRGPPAVIQIAFKDRVYVFQIGEMLGRGRLPTELLNLLKSPQILKAGRQVNGDLQQLASAAKQPVSSFCGGVDLLTFAKSRFLITRGNMSLVDLFAEIFKQCLPKHDTERISSSWSDAELSPAQLRYAARDAHASLLLYLEINKAPIPITMNANTKPGTPILLLTDDRKRVAARGVISSSTSTTLNGINISKTRTIVTVQEILLPAVAINVNTKSGAKRKALKSYEADSFDLVAIQSHVLVTPSVSPSTPSPSFHQTLSESDTPTPDPPDLDIDAETSALQAEFATVGEGIEEVDKEDGLPGDVPSDFDPKSAERDPRSDAEGQKLLGTCYDFAKLVRSRVLKDIFHVFHMIYISRTHGLRLAFCRAFRDACLIPHPADKARIEAYLKTKGLTWDIMLRLNPKWLWRRCRRTVPPAELLHKQAHEVLMLFGALKDAKTGLPLFNSAAWKMAKNILELFANGHVSDIPGVQLYTCIGFDEHADGLPLYGCARGTNFVEGGVHTHLLRNLPSRGASVRHMVACLHDFVLRHNLHVGHFNSTGKKYLGHDSIWLLNEIQELEITLSEYYAQPPLSLAWVNGNLYQQTERSIGIIKIPKGVCEPVKIQPFSSSLDGKQKQAYLARMQDTRKAVLPVHTTAEKRLFRKLMQEEPAFRDCKTTISLKATEHWNRLAETTADVYYKLEEQLTSYLNGAYKDFANCRQSYENAREVLAPLDKALRDPHRSDHIVNAPLGPLVPHRVESGFATEETDTEIDLEFEAELAAPMPSSSRTNAFASANNTSSTAAAATITTSLKRTAAAAAITFDVQTSEDHDENAWASKMWAVYVAEAEKYDTALVDSWKSDMEALVIFAALFSAILTAFIIESYQDLSVTSGDTTVQLLTRISAQLEASANGTAFQAQEQPPFTPLTSTVLCNSLWFFSLGLSLSCALIATLVQQWARDFLHKTDIPSAPLARARIFSFLYYGLKSFRMHEVVEILPLMLHVSLLLFFAGLVAFFTPINLVITLIGAGFLLIVIAMYVAVTLLPLLYINAPYRTPLSNSFWTLSHQLWTRFARTSAPSVAQPRSAMQAISKAASSWDPERDKRALVWTLKSTLSDNELERFAETIPHLLWGSDARRPSYSTQMDHLTVHPEVRLFRRVFALLKTCDSGALTAQARLRRRVICLETLWALGTIAAPTTTREEATPPVGFELLDSDAPEIRRLRPGTRAMIRWRGYCALRGQLRALHHALEEYQKQESLGQTPDYSNALEEVRRLNSQWLFDYPENWPGGGQTPVPPSLPGLATLVSKWLFGLPYRILFDYYAETANYASGDVSRRNETISAIAVDPGADFSLFALSIYGAIGSVTLSGFGSGDLYDMTLSAILSFWRPSKMVHIQIFMVKIINDMPSDKRLADIIGTAAQLEHRLWDHLATTMHNGLKTRPPAFLAAWRLAVIYPATPEEPGDRRAFYPSSDELSHHLSVLDTLAARSISRAVAHSASSLVKCNILRFLDLPLKRVDTVNLLDPSIWDAIPILPTESAVTRPPLAEATTASCRRFIRARAAEARIVVLAEFLEGIASPEGVHRPCETLSALQIKSHLRWPARGGVHGHHQRRFAAALAGVLHAEVEASVLAAIFDLGVWKVYAAGASGNAKSRWLDDDDARQVVVTAIEGLSGLSKAAAVASGLENGD